MELITDICNLLQFFAIIFVVVIFFIDPVRRWNFFGYRPTAVLGIFDPDLGTVLMSQNDNAWSFNQGGMYEENIYITVKDIIKRELGFGETRFKLLYYKPLGTVRIKNRFLLTRARISSISLYHQLRGKGYLACFLRTNLKDVEKEMVKGAGVQDVKIVPVAEAIEMVKASVSSEHQSRKKEMILSMLQEIEQMMSKMKQHGSGE
jgi:hypothetical protein